MSNPVTISFQMFSSRAAESLDAQLSLLAELGLEDVQPFFFGPPASMAEVDDYVALLKKYDLTAQSGHFLLEQFEDTADQVEQIAKAFGMWLVVCPFIVPQRRPSTPEGWDELGAKLAEITLDMARRGLTFAYHNHEFEMEPLADGTYPIDRLLGNTVPFEPDLAWMVVGKADPRVFVEKYKGRIPAAHIKDVAPEGENLDEKGFADLGHGTMDWAELWDLCIEAGSRINILEHDLPSDWQRFARRSVATALELQNRTED